VDCPRPATRKSLIEDCQCCQVWIVVFCWTKFLVPRQIIIKASILALKLRIGRGQSSLSIAFSFVTWEEDRSHYRVVRFWLPLVLLLQPPYARKWRICQVMALSIPFNQKFRKFRDEPRVMSLRENLKPRSCQQGLAEIPLRRFGKVSRAVEIKRWRLICCLLYGLLLCLCKPVMAVIGPWALCMGYWPSVRSRWLDIDQVLFLLVYGPRRSRSP